MLSEGSNVKGSPEDKQASAPYVRGNAKISQRVTLALYTSSFISLLPACLSSYIDIHGVYPHDYSHMCSPTPKPYQIV